ncbi:MAG: UTP--glucose-1-phosphate uridylyltransferase [Planctomycetia bacterium]|nr:UTP--glucose-1-phosphate uridylyltransferase [Planctomycetia bacterium]
MKETSETILMEKFRNILLNTSQKKLWEHLQKLSDKNRQTLLTDLSRVNFPLMQTFFQKYQESQKNNGRFPFQISPLTAQDFYSLSPEDTENREENMEGEKYLQQGKLALILLAGGVGSRLNYFAPKGTFPITPLTQKTLFEIHFEKIRRVQQKYATTLRIYLMTSRATDEDTRSYLSQNNYFGIPQEQIFIFQQGEMPAFSPTSGELLLQDEGHLCFGPDGHGGLLPALHHSGAYTDMEHHGIKSVFTFHVDNPLVPIAAPEILTSHLNTGSEMTLLAVKKNTAQERVGNIVRRKPDNKISIVEYLDFPDSFAEMRDETGRLTFWAGSVGIHVLELSFMRQITQKILNDPQSIPWHFPLRKINSYGQKVDGIKPERFIFDILPYAQSPLVLEMEREEIFTTLKDDPVPVTTHLCQLYKKWLRAANIIFPPDALVEIAPSFATSMNELKTRLSPGTVFTEKEILLQ